MSSKRRVAKVEFLRLLGCIIVVATHCNQMVIVEGESEWLHALRYCLLADGVVFFWMITGFFVFNSSDYISKWKSVITKIVIPTFLLYVLGYFLQNFLYTNDSFFAGRGIADFFNFLSPIAQAKTPDIVVLNHTWYILAYILVMLFLPIVKIFTDWLDKGVVRQIVFLVVVFALWLTNDIMHNDLLNLEFSGLKVVLAAYVLIIWGHIIYQNRTIFNNKLWAIPAIIVLIVTIIIRCKFYIYSESVGVENAFYTMWWTTAFSILIVTCVAVLVFSLMKEKDNGFSRVVCYLASCSFGIYLLHPFIVETFRKYDLFAAFTKMLGDNSYVAVIVSLLISLIVVFLLTFVVVVIIKSVKGLVKKVFRRNIK
ncbi:MAG: acyltransferase [Lachnospiraceae bacterium]|nr:acyltransferase [Lachnospiraceae bacterium]